MASSTRHTTYIDAETVYGTTDATPGFTHVRQTSNTLGVTKDAITSEELYTDRNRRDLRHGNKNIAGDIVTEMTYGSHDDQLEAVMGGTWSAGSVTVTASTISATASGNTIDDSGSGFGSFAVGDMVSISGFTGGGITANNSIGRVTAASAASLTLDGITLIDDAAGESVTVKEMQTLVVGTTRRSFSVMRDFADLTAGRYQLFTGMELNSLNVSTSLNANLNATYNWMGQGVTSSSSDPAGATYSAATTTEPWVGFDGCVTEGGATSAIISALDFSVTNGLEAKFNICSDETAQHGINIGDVTGNITAYFDDDVLLAKFLDETSSKLLQYLTDAAGNKFGVYFPNIKYTGGQSDTGGEANTTISLPFTALYESTTSLSSIIIFRLAA